MRAQGAGARRGRRFAVGPVYAVTERATPRRSRSVRRPAAAKASSTPVEPGTQDVTADVTVSFQIR